MRLAAEFAELITDSLLLVSRAGAVEDANGAAERLLGVPPGAAPVADREPRPLVREVR